MFVNAADYPVRRERRPTVKQNTNLNQNTIGYKDVLAQKPYRKLLAANLINRFGDSVDAIVFSWLIYMVTGNAAWSSIIFGLNYLPTIFLQPLASVWVERLNKKRVMIAADLIRGFLVLVFIFSYTTHILSPWLMVLLTLFISSVEAFRIPAGVAFVPQVIDLKYYSWANSLNQTASSVVQLIGTGAGGIILSVFGIPMAMAVDAFSLFASAAFIGWIRPAASHQGKQEKTSYLSSLKEGFSYLKRVPLLMHFFLMAALLNAILVPFNSLLSPYIVESLGRGSEMLSLLSLLITLGMCVGGALYPYVSKIIKPFKILVSGGLMISLMYLFMLLGSLFSGFLPALYAFPSLAMFFSGFGVALMSSCLSVQFMNHTSQEYLSRVSGIMNAIGTASIPMASFLISFAALRLQVETIFLCIAVLCAILFLWIGRRRISFE